LVEKHHRADAMAGIWNFAKNFNVSTRLDRNTHNLCFSLFVTYSQWLKNWQSC